MIKEAARLFSSKRSLLPRGSGPAAHPAGSSRLREGAVRLLSQASLAMQLHRIEARSDSAEPSGSD